MTEKNGKTLSKPKENIFGRAMKIFGGMLLFTVTAVLLFTIFLIAVVGIVTRGPSEEARRIFTLSCNETSALKFLPYWFLSDGDVDAILNFQEQPKPVYDFPELPYEDGSIADKNVLADTDDVPGEKAEIEVIDITGGTYRGKLMIIADPSRVVIGTLEHYGAEYEGEYLYEFIERFGAIGGTNAGGFYDPEGFGNGGIPDGLVIKDGDIAYGYRSGNYKNFMGFDADGILYVGTVTGQAALDMGIISGVSFPPGETLVKDGVRQPGLGGGVNPRTALGQRDDGAVLLLVIEGRHPSSLGATYDDLAEVMEKYGAVNAGMLDGGSSSIMYYEGEQITRGSNIIGMRKLATCILVMPEGERE